MVKLGKVVKSTKLVKVLNSVHTPRMIKPLFERCKTQNVTFESNHIFFADTPIKSFLNFFSDDIKANCVNGVFGK